MMIVTVSSFVHGFIKGLIKASDSEGIYNVMCLAQSLLFPWRYLYLWKGLRFVFRSGSWLNKHYRLQSTFFFWTVCEFAIMFIFCMHIVYIVCRKIILLMLFILSSFIKKNVMYHVAESKECMRSLLFILLPASPCFGMGHLLTV